ncbi:MULTISPECIES: zinc finger BED domain-containing protein [Gaetbulibacter]|uniref:CXXC-20-CXXC protein n=1 Tax=Gaetbulibacter aestuarii TaxID=1502358 RepID=A0ABW7N271_9FLAO
MKVYGKCKKCNAEISYSTNSGTRVEFAMQEGENMTLTCQKCGIKTDFFVDELYAKESKIAQISAGLIFFIGTPIMFLFVSPVFMQSRSNYVIYIIGGFLLIPVIIYGTIKKQDQMRVNSFNRSRMKGRIHKIK